MGLYVHFGSPSFIAEGIGSSPFLIVDLGFDYLEETLDLAFLLPMSQPHPLRVLTTLGVAATVSGTRIKMKLLWMA